MIKIFIDQGHNPVNPNAGAEAFGVKEQDINYEVGIMLQNLLNNNPNFSAKVSRNHPDEQLGVDTDTSLKARVTMAENWGADYFLSIHANANPNPSISGSECYVKAARSQAYWLAERILIGLNEQTGLKNRGIFTTNYFYVVRTPKMPAILVELGYMTNKNDLNLMVQTPNLFSNGIYLGILEYFGLI